MLVFSSSTVRTWRHFVCFSFGDDVCFPHLQLLPLGEFRSLYLGETTAMARAAAPPIECWPMQATLLSLPVSNNGEQVF